MGGGGIFIYVHERRTSSLTTSLPLPTQHSKNYIDKTLHSNHFPPGSSLNIKYTFSQSNTQKVHLTTSRISIETLRKTFINMLFSHDDKQINKCFL